MLVAGVWTAIGPTVDAGEPAVTPPVITSPPSEQGLSFAWPLCARTNAGFGYRFSPFTQKPFFHGGIDLGRQSGLPVRAAGSGRVMTVEERGDFGRMIEIDHGHGYRTRYAHLQDYRVAPGGLVARGQVIGQTGDTGKSTGPHLHFELWFQGVVRDPRKYFERDPVCGG
jgi:murein DD-endopeptidase MepM/ murein hydrolase activator NlpD